MGRAPSQDRFNRIEEKIKVLTPERMNILAGALMGTGTALCTYGARELGKMTTADMSAVMKEENKNIASLFMNSIPFIGAILSSATMYKKVLEKRQLEFKTLRDLKVKILTYEAGLPVGMTDTARESGLKVARAEYLNLEIKLIPYTRAMEQMQIGQTIFWFGFSLWCALHPDVVKQVISSVEKVTIRAIDESSEFIAESSKGINDFVKALLPDLWGLGW